MVASVTTTPLNSKLMDPSKSQLTPADKRRQKHDELKQKMQGFMENNITVVAVRRPQRLRYGILLLWRITCTQVLVGTVYALWGTDIWIYADPSKDLDPIVYGPFVPFRFGCMLNRYNGTRSIFRLRRRCAR